jgi:predicted PurR-regulated permease PerM
VQTWFLVGLFFLLFLAVARLFMPFFTVLLWSVLLYIVFSPLYNAALSRFDLSKISGKVAQNILAVFFSIGTMIIIVVPLIFVGIQLYRQLMLLMRSAISFLNAHPNLFVTELDRLSSFIRDLTFGQVNISTDELRLQITGSIHGSFQTVLRMGTKILGNLGSFVVGLIFMMFSLFFFYIDGNYLSGLVLKAVPIRKDYAAQLITKFKDITRNLFFGYILVALMQASISFIIYSVFRVQGALVFSILTFFCAFIPMIGAGSVWLPLGVFRLISGDAVGGIIFLIVSGFFISTIDNILRPIFLKDRIKLHPFIIFFAILGGLVTFGFNGLILGPMLVILFLTVLDLFLSEHGIA